MRIEFLAKFSKDLDDKKVRAVKEAVLSIIEKVEAAKTLSDIANVKKLSGFKNAYRIRVGDFRMGIFVEGELVQFARIVHRKDIYNVFP